MVLRWRIRASLDRFSLPSVEAAEEFALLLLELLEMFCGEEVFAVDTVAAAVVGRALLELLVVLPLLGGVLAARSSSVVSAFGPVSDQSPRSLNRLNEHEGCFSFLSGMISASRDVLIVF